MSKSQDSPGRQEGQGAIAPPKIDYKNTKDLAFYGGICVALQIVASHDDGVIWHEIVNAVGFKDLKYYVTKVEPEEYELTRFGKYSRLEFGKVVHSPNRRSKRRLTTNESPDSSKGRGR